MDTDGIALLGYRRVWVSHRADRTVLGWRRCGISCSAQRPAALPLNLFLAVDPWLCRSHEPARLQRFHAMLRRLRRALLQRDGRCGGCCRGCCAGGGVWRACSFAVLGEVPAPAAAVLLTRAPRPLKCRSGPCDAAACGGRRVQPACCEGGTAAHPGAGGPALGAAGGEMLSSRRALRPR